MRRLAWIALLAALAPVCASRAETVPRWELGVGVVALQLPEYRGSDQNTRYLLPLPYVAYRLDWFKADREGLRSKIFDHDRVDLQLSANADPPVSSSDQGPRAGMPSLRPTVQIGPSLNFTLDGGWHLPTHLYLHVPVRAVATVQWPPQSAGWTFSPALRYDIQLLPHERPDDAIWRFGVSAGPVYADRRQNAYYYTVTPTYARPGRPAFDAPGGYQESQAVAALSRSQDRHWWGAFIRLDDLDHSVIADSPVVTRRHAVSFGIAYSYTIGRSEERIESDR